MAGASDKLPRRTLLGSPRSNALESFAQTLIKFRSIQETFALELGVSSLIMQAGWLPHRTLPPELLTDGCDIAEVDARLEKFFRDSWTVFEDSLRQSVAVSAPDEELKGVFAECLHAHCSGLHRVAPVLLFPQIERVARVTLMPGSMGKNPSEIMKKSLGELGASQFATPGIAGVRIYGKIADHLYKQVRTPEEVAEAKLDPVPNRHAVLHGRVSYKTEKSSINMLIMADFIFAALATIRIENLPISG